MDELPITDLIGVQVYDILHFLPKKGQIAIDHKKIIALKTTKGSDSNTPISKVVASDDNSSLDEEEMDFLSQHLTRFFRNKKNPSRGFRKDTSSRKDSRYGYKEDSIDESNRQPIRNFVDKIK